MQEQTLVEKLRAVDSIPGFVEVDKPKEYQKLLDQYRAQHPTVDRVALRNFSFEEMVNDLSQKYSGIRSILPIFKDEEYDKIVGQLDKLFDANDFKTHMVIPNRPYITRVHNFINKKLMNPVASAVVAIAVVAASGGVMSGEKPLPFYGYPYAAFGLIMGAMLGSIGSSARNDQIHKSKKDAKYLDAKIREIYR